MRKGLIIGGIVAGTMAVCCALTHRRVIKAVIFNEPLPKAPAWHVWVRPEYRRSE